MKTRTHGPLTVSALRVYESRRAPYDASRIEGASRPGQQTVGEKHR